MNHHDFFVRITHGAEVTRQLSGSDRQGSEALICFPRHTQTTSSSDHLLILGGFVVLFVYHEHRPAVSQETLESVVGFLTTSSPLRSIEKRAVSHQKTARPKLTIFTTGKPRSPIRGTQWGLHPNHFS
jgi:hypothetical protein